MLKTVDRVINFPSNTNLDNMVSYYRSLFNAQGIKNNLPDIQLDETKPFGNALDESDFSLKKDFADVNRWLYNLKNEHATVEIADFIIRGNKAIIRVKIGK